MKNRCLRPFLATSALAAGLLLFDSAKAAVTSIINSPTSSYATIQFDDTTSLNPSLFPGTTLLTQIVAPWGGPAPINNTLALTTDSVTLDFAQGDIIADVILGNYSLSLNNVALNQISPNTGFAHLDFRFSVEFQLDAVGLPSQSTVFPNFSVNGTVQSSAGSFATVNGLIDYYGTATSGTVSLLDTVKYSALFNTPGSFSGTVSGIPNIGTTPNLVANTTLTLVGYIDFMVDPSSINAQTIVPEPTAGLLALLGLPVLLLRRKV